MYRLFAFSFIVLAGSAGIAAQQAAQDPALHLSKSLQDAAGHYASDVDSMRSNGAAICGLLGESKEIGKALSRTFDQRRDTIAASDLDLFAVAGTGGNVAVNTAKQKDAFDGAVRTLSTALPGVFVADGEAVRFGPDYAALGGVARNIPDKKLLQSTGTLVVGGSPLTFEQPAGAKCSDLAATLTAVQSVVRVWSYSSKCLQDPLSEDLNARLGEIAAARYAGGDAATFCDTKEVAAVTGPKLADLIAKHPYLGGGANADFLRKSLAAPETKFK